MLLTVFATICRMAARGARVSMVDPRERRPCLKELEVIYAEQVRTRKEGRNIASIPVTIKFIFRSDSQPSALPHLQSRNLTVDLRCVQRHDTVCTEDQLSNLFPCR